MIKPKPATVRGLLRRAIDKPERLRTPARRRAAFAFHFSMCRTLVEAAARTGVDRRTVNRWRHISPAFDRRLHNIVTYHREDTLELALELARRPRMRPVFYHGEQVGEYEMAPTALALYLVKQADTEAWRAEQRRDRAAFEARVAEEVEMRLAKMPRSTGHWPSPEQQAATVDALFARKGR